MHTKAGTQNEHLGRRLVERVSDHDYDMALIPFVILVLCEEAIYL